MSRLLCVYQHAPTPGAPGIYRHRTYFAELVRRGWQVDLVSTPRNYMTGEMPDGYRSRPYVHEVIEGIDHHWVWVPGGIHQSRARRVANYAGFVAAAGARALALSRPDVVLVSSPPLTVGVLGPLLARRYRRPWLLEVRDIWPEAASAVGWLSPESLPYRALERLAHRLTRSADAVVVQTPGLIPLVRAHGARRVVPVTGAVIERRRNEERRRLTRERLGIADDECTFVYVGAIGVANGIDVLLAAVARVPAGVRARFVVAGDGSARAAIDEVVRREQLERVTLLPPVPRAEVNDLLDAADVGLHLLRPDSTFEYVLPTKVLEYLGSRLPFITTVSGFPAGVAAASGGTAVTSVVELAAAIEEWSALTDVARRRLGDAAYEYGVAQFSLAANTDRLEQALLSPSDVSDSL